MFKKKDYNELTGLRNYTRLVQGTVIRGYISSVDGICVEGIVVGDIECSGKVIISETGFLEGALLEGQMSVKPNPENDKQYT